MTPGGVDGLRYGPLGATALHLCIDMQTLFAGDTPWHAPSMERVLPAVTRLATAHPERTIFTRFIPARNPGAAHGGWRPYYEHWAAVTLDRLAPDMIDLVPSLRELVPPAEIFDKATYGPWLDGGLHRRLTERGIDTLVLTGGETDVCVLGAVLGAVDLGYRTIVVTDALCSASDAMHEATMALYRARYNLQVETASTDTVLEAWAAG